MADDEFTGFDAPTGMDWMQGFDWGGLNQSFAAPQFDAPTGLDWMNNFDWGQFSSPVSSFQGFPSTYGEALYPGWGGQGALPSGVTGGGGSSWMPQNLDQWMKVFGAGSQLAQTGFGAWNAINRAKQLGDYNDRLKAFDAANAAYRADYNKRAQAYDDQVKAYVDAQNEYLAQRQAYEGDVIGRFGESQAAFEAQNQIYQGQLAEARGKSQEVMDQFLATARPFLKQSQELLVPAVAALARGEVPAVLEPVLNQMKQRGMAAMTQNLIAGGMSPAAARAAAMPAVEQQAHAALLAQATAMAQQAGELGKIGQAGLQGAGTMSDILGRLIAMGMDPYTKEFQLMAQLVGSVVGSSPGAMAPPHPPTQELPPAPPSAPVTLGTA